MTSFDGKVVLIAGAKGGLGATVTSAFLGTGATVAGVSRSIRGEDFPGDRFLPVPAELTSSAAAQAAVDSVISQTGRIDALVHLVGAYAGGTSVADTDAEVLAQMIEMNLNSAFYLFKAVLGHMRTRETGRIVAIGSRAAIEPGANAAAYSASKAALVALVKAVAAENASYGITANILLPGTMDTPANRKAMPDADFTKWVAPEQVATLIVALASDDLSHVNGVAIPIYGRDMQG